VDRVQKSKAIEEKKEASQRLRAKKLNLFNRNVKWRTWIYNNNFDNSNAEWRDDSKYDKDAWI